MLDIDNFTLACNSSIITATDILSDIDNLYDLRTKNSADRSDELIESIRTVLDKLSQKVSILNDQVANLLYFSHSAVKGMRLALSDASRGYEKRLNSDLYSALLTNEVKMTFKRIEIEDPLYNNGKIVVVDSGTITNNQILNNYIPEELDIIQKISQHYLSVLDIREVLCNTINPTLNSLLNDKFAEFINNENMDYTKSHDTIFNTLTEFNTNITYYMYYMNAIYENVNGILKNGEVIMRERISL